MRNSINAGYVRRLLDYEPKTGLLTWRERSSDMFEDDSYWSAEAKCNQWNAKYSGTVAGTAYDGYVRVWIKQYRPKAHQLIWLIMTGSWPKDQIDHRNGDGTCNRWQNLREATNGENSQNRKRRANNKSGFIGVYKDGKRWRAEICLNGTSRSLGSFRNKDDARQSYLEAKAKYHLFQPVPRDI